MKSNTLSYRVVFKATLSVLVLYSNFAIAEDIFLSDGASEQIDYTVNGSVVIEDANLIMIEPAHILGAVVSGSGAVVDIYGGQIDIMLLISTSAGSDLPDGQVTVYGTDFAVDGIPVDPTTTELYIPYQTLSGTYYNGTPFSFLVDCYLVGSSRGYYFQKVKLGWIQHQPDIELSETDYDFGHINIGDEQRGQITIYNEGETSLTINDVKLEQEGNLQFDFKQLDVLPVSLDPDEWLALDIFFKPAIEGLSEATLSISSDDPNDPVVSVQLIGIGMPLTPEEQIDSILDFYQQSLEEGTIWGIGDNRSANNKVSTFEKMLLVAQKLIISQYDDLALEALSTIEKKCDGQSQPKDFIEGDEAAALNAAINELISSLKQ